MIRAWLDTAPGSRTVNVMASALLGGSNQKNHGKSFMMRMLSTAAAACMLGSAVMAAGSAERNREFLAATAGESRRRCRRRRPDRRVRPRRAERMGQLLGQQVYVENVPGAGGMVGGQSVARAKPDGYSAILGTIATHTHSQNLYKAPLYNSATDFRAGWPHRRNPAGADHAQGSAGRSAEGFRRLCQGQCRQDELRFGGHWLGHASGLRVCSTTPSASTSSMRPIAAPRRPCRI